MTEVRGDTVVLSRKNDKVYIDGVEVRPDEVAVRIMGLQTEPKIPRPFAKKSGYLCEQCRQIFKTRMEYRGHYAFEHILAV